MAYAWRVGGAFTGGFVGGIAFMRMAQVHHRNCQQIDNDLARAKDEYYKASDAIWDQKMNTIDARDLLDLREYAIKELEKKQDCKCTGIFAQTYSLIPKEW